MNTVPEIKSAMSRFSAEEMRQVYDWLENRLEDYLPMTDEFKGLLRSSEREMAEGVGRLEEIVARRTAGLNEKRFRLRLR